MDSMEKRLKRSEELIQHIVEGNAANRDGWCYDLCTFIFSVYGGFIIQQVVFR